MKVQAHFVAESANFAADGTFTVYKGGITDLNAEGWPALTKVAIVTRLELDHDETSQLVELTLRFLFDGQEIVVARQPLAVKVPEIKRPIYVNSITEIGFPLPGPGRVTIEAMVNEARLPLLYLWAQLTGTPPT